MNMQHTKSPCCQAPIRRYGGRRRQCLAYYHTWRVYQKKRGKKQHRIDKNLLVRTLIEKQTLKQQARRIHHLSIAGLGKRFRKTLNWFIGQPRKTSLIPEKLVLISDGFWFSFKKKDWVLYLMAIKPVKEDKATLLDPVLLPGKESYENWKQVIKSISPGIRRCIKAFVSDNFRVLRD